MAMTTTTSSSPSQNHHSPRSSGGGGGGDSQLSSQKLQQQQQKYSSSSSAWAQVVKGESESSIVSTSSPSKPISLMEQQSSFSDCYPDTAAPPPPAVDNSSSSAIESSEGDNSNAGRPKKAAWKKPSSNNGVAAEASPVMGAFSWPALSESTKPNPKSSSPPSPAESSAKIGSDHGSIPATPQGPVIPHSNHKQATGGSKSNSTQKHTMLARQRSTRRGSGGGQGNSSGSGHSHSIFTRPPPPPPPPPPFHLVAVPTNAYVTMMPAMPDQSPRDPSYRGKSWEPRPIAGFVPQPPVLNNDHRHSTRRPNFGTRGDGAYHNGTGSRREQDRSSYVNPRDSRLQPQRVPPRGFIRPPPNTAAFVPPQPVRPFANPMALPDLLYVPPLTLDPFRGMSFIAHAPAAPVAMHVPQPTLPEKLVQQIEYYFSDKNLVRDEYLKSNMDDQGWVPITLIAGFNRVKNMGKDIQFILDSLKASTILELQDEKVRRRHDWMRWIPSSSRRTSDSELQASGGLSDGTLVSSLQKMKVDEASSANMNRNGPGTSSSELTAQSHIPQQKIPEEASSG